MDRDLPALVSGGKPDTISPLQIYLKKIAKYPLLSPQEEFENACKHFQDGDRDAAHRLVTANLRLVVKIANDFRQAQISTLDLIQEGNYGLMMAVKKFNPYKGVKLSSYAAWWIRAYILKYIMDNKSQVKIGTTAAQRKLFFNLRKEADRLLLEYDQVDPKLLAAKLEVKEKDVVEMQMRLSGPDASLDAPLPGQEGGDESVPRIALLADKRASVEELLSSGQIEALFGDHLREFQLTLKERDLDIFLNRLLSEDPLTLQQIGDKYGITRERARQLENRVIKSLKAFVKEKGLIEIED